ncbi:periplasmic [Fe] hydrogenase large subunit [Desulfoluna limicola]|uniref:Periplasmic [Fe] hydrogenase large subunit n=1 Tax=Desulfoluna limicola TaxID=2810562 RepID=A0ABN6F9K3_9BACT|nr:[FeFe] hydrogenase, group A [Desulfoluna limicola]BCS98838.1 periplasmic [Fe] hydrogenase large subunit [Desulfoluna limicola]
MSEAIKKKPELGSIKVDPSGTVQKMEGVNYTIYSPRVNDLGNLYFVEVDSNVCEGCGECETHCPTGAIQETEDGTRSIVDPAACMNCGQCLTHCPYGAVTERVSYVSEIFEKLKDPDTVVVTMTAPAVRYALGECFGTPVGTYTGGKMQAALRRLGFDYIWDNEWTADVTIMEEGTELLERVKHGGKGDKPLPQFTSCCPGWIKFCESFYPDLIPHLSTCKSPVGMLGPLAKTYGAEQTGVDPKKIYTVSIMPCIAKKYEGLRPEMHASGQRDIDATINTRELAYMIKKAGINYMALPDEEPDPVLGMATGAATIFGTSGGVMEAALRLAYEVISGKTLADPSIIAVRTANGINKVDVDVPGFGPVRIAVVSGLDNAAKVCEEVRAGTSNLHFIEVMTCPGGCVNGGGQPVDPSIMEASVFKKMVAKVNKRFNMRKIA